MKNRVTLRQQKIEAELLNMRRLYSNLHVSFIKITEQYDTLQENYHKVCALKMEELIHSLSTKTKIK